MVLQASVDGEITDLFIVYFYTRVFLITRRKAMLDGVSKVASTVASVAPIVMLMLGAGLNDDELKRLSGQLKKVQKRLRSFVGDKVATLKDDAFAQGYNQKDPSHRKQMSRMVSEYRKAVRTRLGIYNKKSEIQNAEATARDFRN
jgi:hypothetical protein